MALARSKSAASPKANGRVFTDGELPVDCYLGAFGLGASGIGMSAVQRSRKLWSGNAKTSPSTGRVALKVAAAPAEGALEKEFPQFAAIDDASLPQFDSVNGVVAKDAIAFGVAEGALDRE